MTWYLNLTSKQLIQGKTDKTRLQSLGLHQGDRFTLELYLIEETGSESNPLTVVALPAEFSSIAVGGRPKDSLNQADLLFSATGFVAVGVGDELHYEAILNLNTAGIGDLFPDLDPQTARADVLVDIELKSADALKRLTPIEQWPTNLFRDIYKGDEGVPEDGDPVYPPAANILTNASDSALIKRGSKAVTVAAESLAVAFVTAFPAPPTTLLISPLKKTNPGDADPPFVKAWHSLTAAGFTAELSGPAPAAASFHWLAIA